ncbi:hypothetical protein AB0C93_25355 [Streptomyces sp. NPDC048518]|uniref:hypothetical protein n=1 Tax=Streptomyces sp. NPDC048518 TaxID=3155029 RepID=UPI0033F6A676
MLGRERVRAELRGGLPLALRVAAAGLADQPDWSLESMYAELSDESRRLSLRDVEDTGVRAALRLVAGLPRMPHGTSPPSDSTPGCMSAGARRRP